MDKVDKVDKVDNQLASEVCQQPFRGLFVPYPSRLLAVAAGRVVTGFLRGNPSNESHRPQFHKHARIKRSMRPVTLAEADARPLPVRLRDGLARLLTPYL